MLAAANPSPTQAAANGLGDAINAWLSAIGANPTTAGVQIGLTALVIAVAIVLGPWIARHAGQVPVRVETSLTRSGRGRRSHHVIMKTDGLGAWIGRVTLACIWLAAIVLIGIIWSYTKGPNTGQISLTIKMIAQQFVGSLIVIAASLGIGSFLQKTLVAALARNRVNPNLEVLIGRLLYTAILLVGLVIVLAIWGVGLVIPVTLIGVLTVALSLALQDILKNIVAGIYLLLEHPFFIGDYISVTPYSGQVEDIQIRVTWLRTSDGQRVIVPNALLFTSPVVNQTAYHSRRSGLTVTLPASAVKDMDRVEEQILAALDEVPDVKDEPAPQVSVSRASSEKLELRVIFWLPANAVGLDSGSLSEAVEQIRTRVPDAEVALLDAAAATGAAS